MNAVAKNCVPVKLSAFAQLVWLAVSNGVTSASQIAHITGHTRQAVYKARKELDEVLGDNWGCHPLSTRVVTDNQGCHSDNQGLHDDLSHRQNSGQLPHIYTVQDRTDQNSSADSSESNIAAAAAAEPEDPTSKISAKNRRPLAARLKAIIGDRPCQGDPAETILVLSDTFKEDVIGEALTRLALRVSSGEKFTNLGRILPFICADIREEEEERARNRKPKMRNLWVPDYMQ